MKRYLVPAFRKKKIPSQLVSCIYYRVRKLEMQFRSNLTLPNAIPGSVRHDVNNTDVVSEFPKPTERNIISRRRQRHIVF
jgi:hypothetical protein